MQLWFNAPHSPWTELRPGREMYDALFYEEGSEPVAARSCESNTKHRISSSFFQWPFGKQKGVTENQRIPLNRTKEFQYKTMVAAMDRSLGFVLDSLDKLRFERETIVVFTSDNGPERNVGSAGPYREMKRSLLEGGVRVPTIIRWPGKVYRDSLGMYYEQNVLQICGINRFTIFVLRNFF